MSILLINPPVREGEISANFPSGLGYIASSLLEENIEVHVLDIDGYQYTKKEVINKLDNLIKKYKIKFIGIGCLITCYNYVKWLIKEIKKIDKSIEIIVGGGIGTSIPERVIENLGADIAVMGEGEKTIKELIKPERDLRKIKGICCKYKNRIIKNPQEMIKNLDELHFPAWDLFPVKNYIDAEFGEISNIKEIKGKKSMNVVSGRGCPFNCSFCYDPLGHKRRVRTSEDVIKEIKHLKKNFGVEVIMFSDPLFIAQKEWVYEFCDKLDESKIKVYWICTGRVNIVDRSLLEKMKKAGCVAINYGIESGSQKILNEMGKNAKVEQALNAIKITREVGIYDWTSFMIGMPGETMETAMETAKFCIDADIFLETMFFATAYPGTRLYEEVKKGGIINNEEDYISKLGNATELVINITSFNLRDLFNLRKEVVKKVQKAFFKKHRGEQLKWFAKKTNWFIEYLKKNGIKEGFKKIKNKVI